MSRRCSLVARSQGLEDDTELEQNKPVVESLKLAASGRMDEGKFLEVVVVMAIVCVR